MPPVERRRVRILVVEDNEADIVLVRKLLSDVPQLVCEFDVARSCAEAVEKFSSPNIDLCLLDYHLEDGDGLDLVKRAAELGCRFPIVFLTGEDKVSVAVESIKAGATDYLVKRSLSREVLVRAIEKALPSARETQQDKVVLVGALPEGTTLFEYRLERVLGHGGFGITYLAWDNHLDKQVAIKEYLPDELAVRSSDSHVSVRTSAQQDAFQWGLQQFLKEAKALARFSHPNLIRVLRFFEANSTAYFVTEYVKGETLSDLIKREGMLPEHRLRAVLLPIMGAVEEVHRVGVLHRDIKPGNILMQMDGAPVLIDFGAARVNVGSKTQSVMAVYSAGYAPVEQYSTEGNQGPWTDIYALAAVAYTALSGRKPAESLNRLHDDPVVPAALAGRGRYAPAFLKAVDWGLSLRAEDRPRSIAEWRAAFGDATRAVPGAHVAPPAAQPEPPTRPVPGPAGRAAAEPVTAIWPPNAALKSSPRRYGLWAGVGLAALAAVGTLVMLALQRERPATAPSSESAAAPAAATVAPAAPAAAPSPEKPAATPPVTTQPAATQPAAVAPAVAAPAPAPVKPAQAAPVVASAPAPTQAKTPPPAPAPKSPVAQMTPLSTFQDCMNCPAMTVLPSGSYEMGAAKSDQAKKWEGPAHTVALRRIAFSRHEVTRGNWSECASAGACAGRKASGTDDNLPVVEVTWNDARTYAAWLSQRTARKYRLPSESEWEYAVRGGTKSLWFWGNGKDLSCTYANAGTESASGVKGSCDGARASLAPVGSSRPNRFGLYDLAGNAWEWTLDCWRDSYAGAPADGTAVDAKGCTSRVIRGGSWKSGPETLRSTARGRSAAGSPNDGIGFRVVTE